MPGRVHPLGDAGPAARAGVCHAAAHGPHRRRRHDVRLRRRPRRRRFCRGRALRKGARAAVGTQLEHCTPCLLASGCFCVMRCGRRALATHCPEQQQLRRLVTKARSMRCLGLPGQRRPAAAHTAAEWHWSRREAARCAATHEGLRRSRRQRQRVATRLIAEQLDDGASSALEAALHRSRTCAVMERSSLWQGPMHFLRRRLTCACRRAQGDAAAGVRAVHRHAGGRAPARGGGRD